MCSLQMQLKLLIFMFHKNWLAVGDALLERIVISHIEGLLRESHSETVSYPVWLVSMPDVTSVLCSVLIDMVWPGNVVVNTYSAHCVQTMQALNTMRRDHGLNDFSVSSMLLFGSGVLQNSLLTGVSLKLQHSCNQLGLRSPNTRNWVQV